MGAWSGDAAGNFRSVSGGSRHWQHATGGHHSPCSSRLLACLPPTLQYRATLPAHPDPSLLPTPSLPSPCRYQQYLTGMVEAGDAAFGEVEDILARHATLQAANADLRAQQAACAAEAEAVRGDTAALVKALSAEVLHLNNRLAALKKEAEAAQAEAAALEAGREFSQRGAAARALEVGQVAAAAANLYQRVLQRSRVAHARDEAGPLAQLEAVAHYLGDLGAALQQQQQQSGSVPSS